ncbi:DUF2768 domain-containing protein [Anaerobacillus sp. CMMVII]|uniref:DUF2768 domain-containing protein n=1 Tax=Anaerobacillus sp. CMMVII TaxID=2755588 RepID=UPI0021B7EC31|nr:DUF2768 domain-containing protein [Anaerobacillus sp. CMMVII]MCT8138882.1 DUF2768 domain-containing protein [Anaerobacillus sp. CMMVII]
MTEGLLKMWVSFIAMGLMFFAVFGSVFARKKLSGIFQKIVLGIAFICIVFAGIIILLLVVNVPTV